MSDEHRLGAAIREAATEEEAARFLVGVWRDGRSTDGGEPPPLRDRLAALKVWLDRGFGKVRDTTDDGGTGDQPATVWIVRERGEAE